MFSAYLRADHVLLVGFQTHVRRFNRDVTFRNHHDQIQTMTIMMMIITMGMIVHALKITPLHTGVILTHHQVKMLINV